MYGRWNCNIRGVEHSGKNIYCLLLVDCPQPNALFDRDQQLVVVRRRVCKCEDIEELEVGFIKVPRQNTNLFKDFLFL